MSKLTFYTQERVDGGRRIGIALDGETALERFETGGAADFDPALLWYVDIRCKGEVPTNPESARNWLLEKQALLKNELNKLGERLQVGLDCGPWPLRAKVEDAPQGVEITMVCSTLRRVPSPEFGGVLARLAETLVDTLASLGTVAAAA